MFRAIARTISGCRIFCEKAIFTLYLKLYRADYSSFKIVGRPFLSVAKGGILSIGPGFKMNNRPEGNAVGGDKRSVIRVESGAYLKIGRNVGISSAVIVATCGITVGDNVKIGGGAYILDSDFHSLNASDRLDRETDMKNARSAAVVIGKNALIGARCMILKGCTIGENAIIGAGSVVTKSIPAGEVWAGNPARKIR